MAAPMNLKPSDPNAHVAMKSHATLRIRLNFNQGIQT